MTDSNDSFLQEIQMSFLEEVLENISSVEGCYLQLEKNTEDLSKLSQILRLFHNLKGSAAAVGFSHLSDFCHKVENLLVGINKQEIKLDHHLVDLLLKCNDRVIESVRILQENLNANLNFDDLTLALNQVLNPPETDKPSRLGEPIVTATLGPSLISKTSDKMADSGVDFSLLGEYLADITEHIEAADRALIDLEKNPENKDGIHSIFRAFHTIKSSSTILNLTAIESMAHEIESLLEHVRQGSKVFSTEISSLCLDGSALLKKLAEAIKKNAEPAELGAFFIEAHHISQRAKFMNSEIEKQKTEQTAVPAPEVAVAVAIGGTKSQEKNAALREPLRVDADRLDRLVDLIGELVIAEAMVTQSNEFRNLQSSSELARNMDRLDKITRNIQQIGMSLRMVPVRQTFNKMNRIVRDIAKKVGKEVEFVVQGEETEIDRTIAEKIGDPLVHMVRNAVDHGLEKTAEDRKTAGKSVEGRVELKAYHKAGSVWIDVCDDGRGLDRDRLIKKALETGFLRPGQNISDEEADQLIFMPGLSTAEKVTDVSGRGVGMDVVKKNIQEIHGNIEIESKKGKGTRFKIRIPNTLAIIEGMLIVVGHERYVIPAQSIVRAVNALETTLIRNPSGRGRMIEVNNEFLPLIYLGHFYEIPDAKMSLSETIVLIVEDNNRKLALVVDKILRKQQFVIKPLGEDMKNVPGIVGGTILPDGLVGLIIDIGLLLQDASTNHNNNNLSA